MRFDEAVEKINYNTKLWASYASGKLHIEVCSHNMEWVALVEMSKKGKLWSDVVFCPGRITDSSQQKQVSNEDLFYALKVIDKLLETPVNKRFKEKKYHLKWLKNSDGQQYYLSKYQYLKNHPSFGWPSPGLIDVENSWLTVDNPNCEAATFTSTQLALMKRDNPEMADAIDAMTVEADDDE